MPNSCFIATFQTFSSPNIPTDFWNCCLEHWGVQILGYYFEYLDRESSSKYSWTPWGSSYFRGVQILQHYSEVIGPGGPNTSKYLDRGELFQWGPFFS